MTKIGLTNLFCLLGRFEHDFWFREEKQGECKKRCSVGHEYRYRSSRVHCRNPSTEYFVDCAGQEISEKEYPDGAFVDCLYDVIDGVYLL